MKRASLLFSLAALLLRGGYAQTAQSAASQAPQNPPAVAPRNATSPAVRTGSAAPAVPSYKDLKYPALKPISIPNVETFTLSNGMKVFLLEDHELPVVSGTALVRTGNLFDPADKVGLASITGMAMRTGGTKAKTGDELDRQLEDVAASVETEIGETSGSVSFSALKENTDEVLGVFRDVLTQPEFRQDKIDLAKTELRGSIARRNDEAHGISQREFANIVYGKDTPYGWDIEYATVDRITRDDLINFYQRYFFPANILLGVTGDFNTAEMKTKLEQLFGGWKAQQPPVPAFPAVRSAAQPGSFLAVKTDVTQTFFVLGHQGGVFRDKDYPALEVMADILGGGFHSRLFQRVRTRMGNAYEISAVWGANYDHPGLFEIEGSTKSPSTVDTIKAIREEVERIRSAEVTDAELQTAKDSALNSLVFAYDTRVKTLRRMLTYEYFGYPKDFIQVYQKGLAAVSKQDVLRVAKKYLNPANFTLVAVGNPQDFGQQLEALGGPVSTIDLTIPSPTAETAKRDSSSLAGGKQLLQRVQQAVGGAEKLAAVKDYTEVADFQIEPAAGGFRTKQTDIWISPTYFRQENELPVGKVVAYSDGKTGWIATPQGQAPLGGAQLKQVQGALFRSYFRLLLSDQIPGRTVNLLEPDTLEISDGGEVARLVVNPQTGLPDRIMYDSVAVSGPAISVVNQYGDFREVDGVKVPHKIEIMQGGRKFAHVTVSDYKFNAGIKAEDLNKRP
jgi:zinc protease